MTTDKPKSEKSIDLNSQIRKAVAFEISLSNPLNETIIFDVVIEGEYLLGDQALSILPNSKTSYELIFSPLRVFRGKGSIAFIHEKLGEIWYELNLVCEDNAVIKVPTLKAELGKVEQFEILLENPSNIEVNVDYQISNKNNFDVLPENIVIQPYNSALAYIIYTPTDLDKHEVCNFFIEGIFILSIILYVYFIFIYFFFISDYKI